MEAGGKSHSSVSTLSKVVSIPSFIQMTLHLSKCIRPDISVVCSFIVACSSHYVCDDICSNNICVCLELVFTK